MIIQIHPPSKSVMVPAGSLFSQEVPTYLPTYPHLPVGLHATANLMSGSVDIPYPATFFVFPFSFKPPCALAFPLFHPNT